MYHLQKDKKSIEPLESIRQVKSRSTMVPTPHDILLGRGKSNQRNPGNIYFQELIRFNRSRYFATNQINEKRGFILDIMERVKQTGGEFLKDKREITNMIGGTGGIHSTVWVRLSTEEIKQKVAHALQYRQRCWTSAQRQSKALLSSRSQQRPHCNETSDVDVTQSLSSLGDTADITTIPNIDNASSKVHGLKDIEHDSAPSQCVQVLALEDILADVANKPSEPLIICDEFDPSDTNSLCSIVTAFTYDTDTDNMDSITPESYSWV